MAFLNAEALCVTRTYNEVQLKPQSKKSNCNTNLSLYFILNKLPIVAPIHIFRNNMTCLIPSLKAT